MNRSLSRLGLTLFAAATFLFLYLPVITLFGLSFNNAVGISLP
jgi:ABC-type spermidine/putrescine transport system permease subunit II